MAGGVASRDWTHAGVAGGVDYITGEGGIYFLSIYRHEASLARVILSMCLVGGRAYGGGAVGKKLSAKIGSVITFIIVVISSPSSSSLSSSASLSLINASAAFSVNEAGVRYPALLWVVQHNGPHIGDRHEVSLARVFLGMCLVGGLKD